jgi:hypothetical protein
MYFTSFVIVEQSCDQVVFDYEYSKNHIVEPFPVECVDVVTVA